MQSKNTPGAGVDGAVVDGAVVDGVDGAVVVDGVDGVDGAVVDGAGVDGAGLLAVAGIDGAGFWLGHAPVPNRKRQMDVSQSSF